MLQDIGSLDFGSGLKPVANVAMWRTRGEHRPLIGGFAFQIRFRDRKELALDAMQRAERFFLALQYSAKDLMVRITAWPPLRRARLLALVAMRRTPGIDLITPFGFEERKFRRFGNFAISVLYSDEIPLAERPFRII